MAAAVPHQEGVGVVGAVVDVVDARVDDGGVGVDHVGGGGQVVVVEGVVVTGRGPPVEWGVPVCAGQRQLRLLPTRLSMPTTEPNASLPHSINRD